MQQPCNWMQMGRALCQMWCFCFAFCMTIHAATFSIFHTGKTISCAFDPADDGVTRTIKATELKRKRVRSDKRWQLGAYSTLDQYIATLNQCKITDIIEGNIRWDQNCEGFIHRTQTDLFKKLFLFARAMKFSYIAIATELNERCSIRNLFSFSFVRHPLWIISRLLW